MNKILSKEFQCKSLVQTKTLGNDFDNRKFRQKNFNENFWFKPISEEMILQP